MNPRLVKQLLYGALYFLTIFIVFWLIYILFLKPAATCFDGRQNQKETGIDCGGPCQFCELAQLKGLAVNRAIALPARENEVTLLAEIANPNPNFGAKSFSYQFKIIGPFGALLKTVEGQSFIYGGNVKYLIEASVSSNLGDIKQVRLEISTSGIVWQPQAEMTKPSLANPSHQTIISDGITTVKGIIQNKNPLLISKVQIIAVLYNLSGDKIINASYTTLSDLEGNGQSAFSIGFPKGDWTSQLDTTRTRIFIEPEPK